MAPVKEVIKINLTLIKKYFLFFIILFLLLNVFFIKIIFENSRELEEIIGFNKISVKAKDSLAIKQVYGFTENDIFDLCHRLKDNLILFTLPFKTKRSD